MLLSISALLLGMATAGWSVDLGVYKGCAATDADFKLDTLAPPSLAAGDGPLKLAFDAREGNAVDVYFVEKFGALRKYDGVSKAISAVGQLPAAITNEDGLVGIALDPDFKSNRFVYLDYSFLSADKLESTFRISRFRIGGAGTLEMASEKILIKIPSQRGRIHTAGSMQFDAYGDLWIAIGDNGHDEDAAGNTADLRGGILRIHPDAALASGYSIPKGNFGEALAARFDSAGQKVLAAQYADTSKVRPEIYVKGTRNAYTLTVDPVRRWLTWGDVGPDQALVSEENNLVKAPYYMGWPYFAGEENMGDHAPNPYGHPLGTGQSRLTGPVNHLAGIKGVTQLPPIREPIYVRTEACAMTGPIFNYDGANPSPSQFPPQFNRKWMISGCDQGFGFHLLSLDDAGEKVTADLALFKTLKKGKLIDLKQGPDGALYFIFWGGGIFRIRYTGQCRDASLLAEKPAAALRRAGGLPYARVRLEAGWLNVAAEGGYAVSAMDSRGRTLLSWRGEGAGKFPFPSRLRCAPCRILIQSDRGGPQSQWLIAP